MRSTLAKWVSDADALTHVQRFGIQRTPLKLSYLRARVDDYYLSLVGELFQRIRDPYQDPAEWSRLGNALAQTGSEWGDGLPSAAPGIISSETALFAAAAFYFGGYPASAYLTLKGTNPSDLNEIHQACHELLTRPPSPRSKSVQILINAVRQGNLQIIRNLLIQTKKAEEKALNTGPDEWIAWRLFRQMVERFQATNIRAVLPDGESTFWNPLVRSLLNRKPPVWDFFPSQIEAFESGLLESFRSYSLQMPTGAGKTALSEALLFYHLKNNQDQAAVLLVPYRSLASELRGSLVKRLNAMGLNTRCAYGGTVPTGDEVRGLDDTRAIIATPEALSGLLSANPSFFSQVTLVICDEGHLLDGQARGVGLELLLSRMLAREGDPPRFVFVSAIVPNIEEINVWLGGTSETVVRSDYRPALAEFAVLRVNGTGASRRIALQLNPHEPEATRFSVDGFLSSDDFRFRNPASGRLNTYPFSSVKTQAIASARKALSMGGVAVFAANKRGNQGAVGLAEELLSQLSSPLPLPAPIQFVANATRLQSAVEYFALEYGNQWVGTRALAAGAVLHHGDIPQESREVVEGLVRRGDVRLAICTSTLAEGVNLPIRTMVLYSLQRRTPNGAAENLLARDIKNLVGRAGRAGATTKGLVLCANAHQWILIEPVAKQQPGERVSGALYKLMGRLQNALSARGLKITNDILEKNSQLHTLIDGIDATLIDLISEEIGEDELIAIANDLAGQTFAARQVDQGCLALMREVFGLRARRVVAIRSAGRLDWIRETGTRARMLDSVETSLLPRRESWEDISTPTDPDLIDAMVSWAWEQPDMQTALSEAYRDEVPTRENFIGTVTMWLGGKPLVEIANSTGLEVDVILGVHARVFTYTLQVAVEQAAILLKKLLETSDRSLSQAVIEFPNHLRFGVPSPAARVLAEEGVTHRRAVVTLGHSPELSAMPTDKSLAFFNKARTIMNDRERWLPSLGSLVYHKTISELEAIIKLKMVGYT